MSWQSFRYLVGLAFLAAVTPVATAQPKKDAFAEYRQFLKPPETILEYWGAIQFEIELGSFELASKHLRGMLEKKKPTEDELFQLERQVGMAALLRLNNQFANWLNEVKKELKKLDELPPEEKARAEVKKKIEDYQAFAQTKVNIETVITQTTAAVEKFLADPVRIKKYIGLLYATTEEQQYALAELYKSKSAVVPYMIDELKAGDAEKRLIILSALRRLSSEILPALVAALDSDDPVLKVELIDLFMARASREVTPHLWFLAASSTQPEKVREKAREALAYFSLPPERISSDKRVMERELVKAIGQLPSSKVMLTREAEKYYRHQVSFADPKAVTIWRWDGKNVVAGWPGVPKVSASKAEEYYGLRFAGQALALDSTYQQAQILLISLILEKTYEQGGYDRPLAIVDPNVHAVVSSVNPDVLIAVLERALDEKRVPLILAMTRTLGDLAEIRATRPTERADPSLTRALLFADRRVQMAAAEALLRVPGDRAALTNFRIVEVLRRALAADTAGAPKLLIGFVNDEYANKVAATVKEAGFDPIVVKSGRDLLKRVIAAADIEAIIFDADLPDPGLTSLLGQLRGDIHASRIPLFVTPSHQQEDRFLADLRQVDDQLKGAAPGTKPTLLFRRDQIEGQLKVQALVSEAALERFARVYRHLYPLAASSAINVKELQPALQARLEIAVNPPLAESELKEYAEKAVHQLARAAKGELASLDFSVAGETVIVALRSKKLSEKGQIAAIEIVGRLPGKAAQTELVRVILDVDDKRPAAIRLAAASVLVQHMQRNSPLLSESEIKDLREAQVMSNDPAYKAALVQVFGAMRPDARTSGDILRGYQPKVPVAVAPKPEK